jgi:hypothetical protein
VREDGGINLQDGRTLDPGYRQFVPGYAVTSYGSQGRTTDYVLFSDSAVRAATNSRQWYVTISRGRRGIRIFTPDRHALRESVTRSGDSRLALDLIGLEPGLKRMPRNSRHLWRRWTRGWSNRVGRMLAALSTTRRMQPATNKTYENKVS